jgi:hypothetical protein
MALELQYLLVIEVEWRFGVVLDVDSNLEAATVGQAGFKIGMPSSSDTGHIQE